MYKRQDCNNCVSKTCRTLIQTSTCFIPPKTKVFKFTDCISAIKITNINNPIIQLLKDYS